MHKIVVSRWLAGIAREEYGDEDVSLVPNSVDTMQFRAEPRGRQPEATVGFLYARAGFRGADIAAAAIEKAREAMGVLHVVSFGVEPPDAARPLPSDTRFEENPAQDRLRELYGVCDAWLFASRQEGFGLPILEAMACRTPVIASPAGAAPELLEAGGGVLVGREDPSGMAAAIQHLCSCPEAEWRAASDAAYATAVGYSWDCAAARFEQALHRAIDRR